MTKLTSFLAIGALVVFMGGCAPANTQIEFFTAAADTATVSATASPDEATTPPADAQVDITTDQTADAVQSADPSIDASANPDQSTDATTDQPQDTSSPAPTKTAKPSATPSADASPAGSESSGKALSAKKVTGTAQVSDYLSLRSSASATAEVVTKIPKDGKLTITGVNKDSTWLKVTYSGKSGYVLAKYVLVNGASGDKVCMAINSGSLNVRSGAGTTHKLLGVLKSGTTMVVTEVVKASPDNWYKVLLSGTTGYVNAKYCRIAS